MDLDGLYDAFHVEFRLLQGNVAYDHAGVIEVDDAGNDGVAARVRNNPRHEIAVDEAERRVRSSEVDPHASPGTFLHHRPASGVRRVTISRPDDADYQTRASFVKPRASRASHDLVGASTHRDQSA
jgi:hypothetical protein